MSEVIQTVYIVDDDSAVRKSIFLALKHSGYSVKSYESANAFLEEYDAGLAGCLILDIAMPGMSGLELQAQLNEMGCSLPIIFISAHGDIPISVRAIKGGAVEFLEKPYPEEMLFERVDEALSIDASRYEDHQKDHEVLLRFNSLSGREVDVMKGLVAGFANQSNKEVARDLGISHRTVDEYRARLMRKMQAESITHLAEMAKICKI